MLNDVKQYSRICLAYGYTDLRFGIDGLARVVQDNFSLNPFRKDVLFLFCGRHTDRIKGLIWEGDGFLQEIGPSARVPERVPGGMRHGWVPGIPLPGGKNSGPDNRGLLGACKTQIRGCPESHKR